MTSAIYRNTKTCPEGVELSPQQLRCLLELKQLFPPELQMYIYTCRTVSDHIIRADPGPHDDLLDYVVRRKLQLH